MAGIVHFAQYFRYAEEAEHAFLRSLGLSVHRQDEDGRPLGFPRIAARCEFLRSLRFEDEVEVHIWVHRKGRSSIIYQYRILKGEEPVAQGETGVICCRTLDDGRLEPAPIARTLAEALVEAPYPPLAFRERVR